MAVPIAVVDAFTAQPFAGNPAGVVLLDAWPDDAWLRAVAAEVNLAETAFAVPIDDGEWQLRWFTPTGHEVDLCGHATLATAHVLGRPARFATRSGVLTCRPVGDGWIELDLPAEVSRRVPLDPEVVEALGAAPRGMWRGSFLLVELADAAAVRELHPDLDAIAAREPHGIVVTAAGDRDGIDCVSRVFAPAIGIPEDPVTGSAHCQLAPFWGLRLARDELVGEQASARGGLVQMRLLGDRVLLAGQAVTVWEGRLLA
jgi:predicted PhzF superfamily epimerase YddE/YHI9